MIPEKANRKKSLKSAGVRGFLLPILSFPKFCDPLFPHVQELSVVKNVVKPVSSAESEIFLLCEKMLYFFDLGHTDFPKRRLHGANIRLGIPVWYMSVQIENFIPGCSYLISPVITAIGVKVIPILFTVCDIVISKNKVPCIKIRKQEVFGFSFKCDLYHRCPSFGIA